MIPSVLCNRTFRGPFDTGCFIPCMIDNCSMEIVIADLCPIFDCTPIMTSTTEMSTTQLPPVTNSSLILGLSIGIPGKI